MTVPIKITYTGDIFTGKNFAKQARVQVGMLKDDMARLGLKQGRRFVPVAPGVTIEARSVFGFDEARIHVKPLVMKKLGKHLPVEERYEWYWYALAVSTDTIQTLISGGGLSDIDVDSMGNVIVVGYTRTRDFADALSELSNEAYVQYYDNDGWFQRRRVLEGGLLSGVNRNESGTGVAIDPTVPTEIDTYYGGVYVTADIYKLRDDNCYDMSLLKYASDGVTIKWKKRFSLGDTGIDDLFSWGVDADAAGNVVVIGRMDVYDFVTPWYTDPYALLYNAAYVVSLNYAGTLNWSLQLGDCLLDINGHPTVQNMVNPYDVAVKSDGDIVIGGSIQESSTSSLHPMGLLTKLNSSGVVQWNRVLEGRFKQANEEYGWYGVGTSMSGLTIRGCSIDSNGDIYCASMAKIVLGTDSGWWHFHLSKVSSTGDLQWQRFAEVQYYDDADAILCVTQIDVAFDGVYIIFPSFPNGTDGWGAYIIKFQKSDSVNPLAPQAGDVLWQHHMALELTQAQVAGNTGVIPRAIRAVGADIYFAGSIIADKSPLTAKLPGSGGFIGNHMGLVFTNPALTIYDDQASIPVHQDPGPGGGTPGYEFFWHDDVIVNTTTVTATISTPSEGDYDSPLWTQTNKIIKKTIYTQGE